MNQTLVLGLWFACKMPKKPNVTPAPPGFFAICPLLWAKAPRRSPYLALTWRFMLHDPTGQLRTYGFHGFWSFPSGRKTKKVYMKSYYINLLFCSPKKFRKLFLIFASNSVVYCSTCRHKTGGTFFLKPDAGCWGRWSAMWCNLDQWGAVHVGEFGFKKVHDGRRICFVVSGVKKNWPVPNGDAFIPFLKACFTESWRFPWYSASACGSRAPSRTLVNNQC